MAILRWRVILGGWSGAPGVNTYFTEVGQVDPPASRQAFADIVDDAYTGVAAFMADDVTINLWPEVHELDEATGQITAVHTVTPPNTVTAIGDGAESRATMAKLRFNTGVAVNGRLLRGGNYVGPLSSAALAQTGLLTSTAASAFAGMWDGAIDALGLNLMVWHRPVNGAGGAAHLVSSASVGITPAVLRSRRD